MLRFEPLVTGVQRPTYLPAFSP